MKNRKMIIITLTVTLLFAGAGISTGFFDKVVTACKAFIYCKGLELEIKK